MKSVTRWLLPLCLFAFAAACGNREESAARPPGDRIAASSEPVPDAGPPPTVSVSGLPDFAPLVSAYGPAVVNVTTIARQRTSQDEAPGITPDDPLYEFFRRFGFGGPRGQLPPERGEGSGFLVSADGYLLTNAHVVDRAREVTVRMTDRREYRARVVGVDSLTDVAVLKIDGRGLPYVRIGDPARLRVGEWVIAIGSPFGFENSVTAGIVSGTARSLGGDAYTPFIQTDVAVNPGNSGGPLFNLKGEVVGINSQIFSRTGGYQGVSFAIPIDLAMNVRDQLVATGHVERGRIGVSIQDVNQALADSFHLSRPRGALVSQVLHGGPAEKAGIRTGDVILGVNGRAIERSSELPAIIAGIRPGSRATLAIWRDRAEREVTLTVAELEDQPVAARLNAPDTEESGKLGLAVRPLTGDERRRLRTQGSLVVEDSDGPAAIAGVEAGDVLLAVNGAMVKTLGEFSAAVERSGETVALLIQRGEAQIYVPVRIES